MAELNGKLHIGDVNDRVDADTIKTEVYLDMSDKVDPNGRIPSTGDASLIFLCSACPTIAGVSAVGAADAGACKGTQHNAVMGLGE